MESMAGQGLVFVIMKSNEKIVIIKVKNNIYATIKNEILNTTTPMIDDEFLR